MPTEDETIVQTVDALEREKLNESKRRFDEKIGFVKTLFTLAILGGAGVLTVFAFRCHYQEDERQAAARSQAYQACLLKGLGDACGCLWDSNACRDNAIAECNNKLSPEICSCITEQKQSPACVEGPYRECLLHMSEQECRCLREKDDCE